MKGDDYVIYVLPQAPEVDPNAPLVIHVPPHIDAQLRRDAEEARQKSDPNLGVPAEGSGIPGELNGGHQFHRPEGYWSETVPR